MAKNKRVRKDKVDRNFEARVGHSQRRFEEGVQYLTYGHTGAMIECDHSYSRAMDAAARSTTSKVYHRRNGILTLVAEKSHGQHKMTEYTLPEDIAASYKRDLDASRAAGI